MSLGSTSMDEQNGGFKNCGEPIKYCSTTTTIVLMQLCRIKQIYYTVLINMR